MPTGERANWGDPLDPGESNNAGAASLDPAQGDGAAAAASVAGVGSEEGTPATDSDPLFPTSVAGGEGAGVDVELARTWASLEGMGFIWLYVVGGLLMIRLLIDPTMVRRPLLDPNLSAGGMVFISCSLFVFLMANVISESPISPQLADSYVALNGVDQSGQVSRVGFHLLADVPPQLAKSMVIVAHLAIVIGLVVIGFRHFANTVMGIGAARCT